MVAQGMAAAYNSYMGTEFMFAIPLNDSPIQPISLRTITVCSQAEGTFSYELPRRGFKRVFPIQKNTPVILSASNLPMPEVNGGKDDAILIRSTVPVCVNLYNGKQVSTDATMLLPTNVWGKEYIHCSFPDFNEVRNWGAGFTIVANENTSVSITMKNSIPNGGSGKLVTGEIIGTADTTITINLEYGESYTVQGNGATRGSFDISGARIQASKPIGLFSYHQRTMIPTFDLSGGRNYMVEMMPPVNRWGNRYVSMEIQRAGNRGDIFRVVAAEANTTVLCRWYNPTTKALLGEKTFNLSSPGSWQQFFDGSTLGASDTTKSIRGVAYWSSDKPFLLMQYCCSASWDNDASFDPFMMTVPPVNQYLPTSVFILPDIPSPKHKVSIVIRTTSANKVGLQNIMVDGIKLLSLRASLLQDSVPGTNLYYAVLPLAKGQHVIESPLPIGIVAYGTNDSFDAYGYNAAQAWNLQTANADTLPPQRLSRKDSVGKTELQFGEERPSDVGISRVSIVQGTESYTLEYTLGREPLPSEIDSTLRTLGVIVRRRPGTGAPCILATTDRAGNMRFDTLSLDGNITLGIPVQQSPANGTSICTDSISVFWNAVDNAEGYTVQVFLDSTASKVITEYTLTGAKLQQVLFSKVPLSRTLWWRVRADGGTTSGDWSPLRSISFTKPAKIQTLSPPKGMVITKNDSVLFSWQPDPLAVKYQLYISNPNGYRFFDTVTATSRKVLLDEAAQSYFWQVTGICATNAMGQTSDDVELHVGSTSAVEDETAETLRIMPNPAQTQVCIQPRCYSAEQTDIVVYSLLAEKLLQTTIPAGKDVVLNIETLSTGVYMVQVRCGNNEYTHPLLIQR